MKQNHIKKSLTTLVFSTLLISSNIVKADQTYASCDLNQDRCSSKPLDKSKFILSAFMGDAVNNALEKIHKNGLQQGKDIKVVLIGRMGSSLENFKMLRDNRPGSEMLPLSDMIESLINESKTYQTSESLAIGGQASGYINYQTLMNQVDPYEKLKYSHLGIAFRNYVFKGEEGNDTTGEGTGRWALMHLLYSCEKPESLKVQGEYIKSSHIFDGMMHSFFADDMSGYKAQIIVPSQDTQNNLENMFIKEKDANAYLVNQFKTNQYNAAARISDMSQQNSNQFVLEAVAAAMYPKGVVTSREQAKDVLEQTGYLPSKLVPTGLHSAINIPGIQKLISNIMPTVCFDSQPELKKHGIGEIVTANSVVNWMRRNNLIDGRAIEVELPKETIEFAKPLDQKK